jgi:CRISPR-associated protein Csb3
MQVNLDVLNPGEVLACCGLAALTGGVSRFEYNGSLRSPNGTFTLDANVDLAALLAEPRVEEISLADEKLALYLPVRLHIGGQVLVIDWWMSFCRSKNSLLKLWTGQTTGVGILKSAINGINSKFDLDAYTETTLAKSVFGFDSRTTIERNTIDVGFSIDEERTAVRIYSWVEILVAVGMQTFRPMMNDTFEYHIWQKPLSLEMAQLAFRIEIPDTEQVCLAAEVFHIDKQHRKLLPTKVNSLSFFEQKGGLSESNVGII